ncbi:amidohydrolase [Arthrobacter crystallopoietes]|uniref:Hippurate hydrolase n=1 Tax=Crystallibacter crystallopoietes TaxID=37928 RepID=A0A1H1BTJ7_9MICC|nr:amidohydrolase [Arthrobacter crystallopoietes]AUI51023.1 amidohydrolase [Arthrobacter crystallopoietes]SDQ55247.1 hippurate hydrolase [Arthrobacter crystallopoietes]
MPAPVLLTDEQRTRMHDLYRQLHEHPELSMQEHRTAALVQAELEQCGIDTFSCGGTGVVGVLRNGEGPVVAFRADIDALPIKEDTGLPFASTATGTLADGTEVPVMHGCGHDAHAAALLTAARLLAGAKDRWAGTIVFIFQPGEETGAGARAMVEDGLWEKAPKPEVVFGQHVMPGLAGTVQYVHGHPMTQADSWKVTLHGRQSHGSQPQDSIDPIVLGAHIITRIQTIVSREVDPRRSAVVTVGTFHGGLKENIIPSSAEFTLNVRAFDESVRDTVLGALRRIIKAEADASNAPEPTIEVLSSFPPNLNDRQATDDVVKALRQELGEASVIEGEPVMASEDFGHLVEPICVPSVFWFFGGHPAETLAAERIPVNHSPLFAPVMEPTLSTGARAAVAAILSKVGLER